MLPAQAGKAALVAEESAVSAASLARAARTQAALRAAMVAAQSYNQVPYPSNHSSSSNVSNKRDLLCGAQHSCTPVWPGSWTYR